MQTMMTLTLRLTLPVPTSPINGWGTSYLELTWNLVAIHCPSVPPTVNNGQFDKKLKKYFQICDGIIFFLMYSIRRSELISTSQNTTEAASIRYLLSVLFALYYNSLLFNSFSKSSTKAMGTIRAGEQTQKHYVWVYFRDCLQKPTQFVTQNYRESKSECI